MSMEQMREANAVRLRQRAYLNHVQDSLNEAHSTLCDKVNIIDQRDWLPDETALLALIDSAIMAVHAMRQRDTKPL